ncbi:hypothetical protein ZIOFF_035091 [Zingiber officinale]|uniref:Uncharacterized protein n=1 Tax=Zingiber officinale TaxID=94328 RepID=A0A8J5G8W2_ZINOF|nr:hypothetical protein ZIOFF_035091 [Zingiber officinale]
MSDVWEFKNGVMQIVEMENLGGCRDQQLLVYLLTEELITSHQMLEDMLRKLSPGGRPAAAGADDHRGSPSPQSASRRS